MTAIAGPNCTSYPIFAAGMAGLNLGVPMPPFSDQLIASLSFQSMALTPSFSEKIVLLSASIIITINSPLGANSPLTITLMDMDVSLIYKDNPVGSLNVLQAPVTGINSTTYQSSFTNKILILDGTGATYEKFAQDFIKANNESTIDFRIAGKASVVGSFALGPLNIAGINVQNNVSLGGLDGLSKVQVDGIAVDGEQGMALQLSINTTIENPGITDVQLENFTLLMADGATGTILGRVPIDVLAIHPGVNNISLKGSVAFFLFLEKISNSINFVFL